MENKTGNEPLQMVNVTVRDFYAAEILKTLIAAQIRHRRMTVLHRLRWVLGRNKWSAHYDCNFEDCAKKSFVFADIVLKERDIF